MNAESVALKIFDFPLYSKVLHLVLAVSVEYSNDAKYKVSESEISSSCDL